MSIVIGDTIGVKHSLWGGWDWLGVAKQQQEGIQGYQILYSCHMYDNYRDVMIIMLSYDHHPINQTEKTKHMLYFEKEGNQ